MWPPGLSSSTSSIMARPSHTLRATKVPSNSTHVFDPVRGCSSRLRWAFQLPSAKSKSCWPSRSDVVVCGPDFRGASVCLSRPVPDVCDENQHKYQQEVSAVMRRLGFERCLHMLSFGGRTIRL